MSKRHFIDVIPQLETQVGISSLEYLGVAVKQAEYYGIHGVAIWLKAIQDRLTQCVEREYSEEEFPLKEFEDDYVDTFDRYTDSGWGVGIDETS